AARPPKIFCGTVPAVNGDGARELVRFGAEMGRGHSVPAPRITTADAMTELSELTTDELLANFELLGDWEERYRYIIDLGRKLPPLADEDRTEENRVHGCQATVWLKETLAPTEPPTIEIRADSDAH